MVSVFNLRALPRSAGDGNRFLRDPIGNMRSVYFVAVIVLLCVLTLFKLCDFGALGSSSDVLAGMSRLYA